MHSGSSTSPHQDAAAILDASSAHPNDWISLGAGMRTRAVLTPAPSCTHRYGTGSTVVVKLYKGQGNPNAAAMFRRFHATLFPALALRFEGVPLQTSHEAGMGLGHTPYAVLSYIQGQPLRSVLEGSEAVSAEMASRWMSSLMLDIWIPLWSRALRFKDCHPGNFLVVPDGTLVMIDTEQMRKSAAEIIDEPSSWNARNAHESSAMRRLPGLWERVALACDADRPKAPLKRAVRSILSASKLPESLARLGRPSSPPHATEDARDAFAEALRLSHAQKVFV